MCKARSKFNSEIRNNYIKDNNICECEKCKIHKSKTSLQIHHKIALADGGTNDYDNLIALCSRCHDEWHNIEGFKDITFEKWLDIPPYCVLVDLFNEITELPGNLSPSRIKRISHVKFNLYKFYGNSQENSKKFKRQKEGIAAKKARGEWSEYGRPRTLDFDKFVKEYKRVLKGEIRPVECMKLLGISKPAYYRYRKEYENNQDKI